MSPAIDVEPLLYTHGARTRRICWIMLACLALPKRHPARVQRLPRLATTLAVHAGRRPDWRPS